LTHVTSVNSRWETDKWPVFVQVYLSHSVEKYVSSDKYVAYSSCGNAL
jgi:hypothetical protein